MLTRRQIATGLLRSALAGPFRGMFDYWLAPSLRLRVQRWQISREDWGAPPMRIAIISDLHVAWPGPGRRRLEQIVARANALAPDLTVLLGDFAPALWLTRRTIPFEDVANLLSGLQARCGVYAVLGNHDWDDDRAAQERQSGPNIYSEALTEAGVPVLSNAVVDLDGVWLAGLEDQRAFASGASGFQRRFIGLDDLPGTLAQIGGAGPAILLAHEPDIFPDVPDRIALTLSGHTHGGQIRVFGRTPAVPSRYGSRYAYGHVREGGRDLVVSGGIGCSGLPLRFGVVPEITVVEISGPSAT
ncbi:MAG: metallophosphoesterase [Pseudomonadota bacterium]